MQLYAPFPGMGTKYTEQQISKHNACIEKLKERASRVKEKHMSNEVNVTIDQGLADQLSQQHGIDAVKEVESAINKIATDSNLPPMTITKNVTIDPTTFEPIIEINASMKFKVEIATDQSAEGEYDETALKPAIGSAVLDAVRSSVGDPYPVDTSPATK